VSLSRAFRRAFRSLLEQKGYWVRHRSVLPFGVDYQHDIGRLCDTYGRSIEVFFDVGANVGQTTSAALTSFPSATVFAFEPDRISFGALTDNHRNPRVQAFNLALSDKAGEARFFDYGPFATSNSLVENAQYAARTGHPVTVRSVQCETLDAFCSSHSIDRIDVLKIDTEGHEMAVLQGSTQMLSAHSIRFVYVEFNTLLPKASTSGGALMPIGNILEPLGFRFVASYAEYMITTGDLFVTSNALFFHDAP
jgi:FkbM family methyltransferase